MKLEFTIKSGDKSFTFCKGVTKGRVWIQREDGEGGEFDQDKVYEQLKKLYDEHF